MYVTNNSYATQNRVFSRIGKIAGVPFSLRRKKC